ncbi:MAG: hypothetical protein K6E62_02860, partial [Lachnospiraceae bacterium]|nr:hypothetical protein [Lachnospiraceae bacterium]
ALVWLVVGLLADIYWGGFILGIIAIVISFGFMFFFRARSVRNEEVGFIPLVCAGAYLAAALILNMIFMLIGDNDSLKMLILLNILLILLFAAAVFLAGRYIDDVEAKSDVLIEKKKNTANASMQVSAVLAIASDPDVKKAVKDLKARIDYSGNVTQAISGSAEGNFISKIQEIRDAVAGNADKSEILNLISQADRIWSERNALHASVK